jgi:DHA1 family bicyclomycin/chloramphenicol resistance-like MFS transporter
VREVLDRTEAGPPLAFLLVLVAITALGPMAMQIMVPALPAIQTGFGVSVGTAQLALSLSTLAMAVATLAYGPLSDRYGRKPVVLGGIVVYLLGTSLCIAAASVHWLIAGRVVQAAGGAAGFVLARAIVRDLYGRERSASVIAYLTMAMVVVPMVSPALGGYLTDGLGWRHVFVVGAVLGVVVLAAASTVLVETHRQVGMGDGSDMLATMRSLLRVPAFRGYALQGACSMALFFAFLAGVPYVVVQVLGRPASEYGMMFALVSGGFMAGNFISARFATRLGIDRLALAGAWLVLGGTVLQIAAVGTIGLGLATLFLPMMLTGFAQGIAMPVVQAGALSVDPRVAGAASGLSGFMQMSLAAAAAQIVGMIQNGTVWPTLAAMLLFALGLLAASLYVWRGARA